MTLLNQIDKARKEFEAHQRWLREHGHDVAGYVERYGSKDDPEHYGDGGEAIYAADRAAMKRAEEHYLALTNKNRSKRS